MVYTGPLGPVDPETGRTPASELYALPSEPARPSNVRLKTGGRLTSRQNKHETARIECRRAVSKVMDEAPEWRGWFARQLELLDLEYDPAHWITMESVR